MKGERTVAGLRCSEVLARLDRFVDGTLSPDERSSVVAHVSGCTKCEEFGGRYQKTIAGIRRLTASEADDADAAKARLLDRLERLR